ncbi:TRAP-type C4-dicarboxylate transport system permease small subunit [Lysinibacillus sp. RC46]|uniref:TRAP transporter small permease n=1 Tax=unclassified Lysinibacillus TaxID=2636778 RepID=UPI003519329D
MAKISQGITKIEEFLMTILMAALAVLMILAVIFRYFLKDPIPWAGEVSIFLLIWTSFIGGSWGLKYGTQASVTFLYDAVSERNKRILRIIQDCIMIAFLFILIYYSYKWMMHPSMLLQKSSSLQLPMWIPYSAVSVGLIFAAIHLISHLIDTIMNREGENT